MGILLVTTNMVFGNNTTVTLLLTVVYDWAEKMALFHIKVSKSNVCI